MKHIEKVYEDFKGWDKAIMKHLNDDQSPVSLEGRLLYHCWIAIKKDLGKN